MAIEAGNVLEGIVTGITAFGAFVELPDKKVGLVHISEVANEYVKDVHDFLKVGDKTTVKVLNVDDRGKIGLSIKQAQAGGEKNAQSERKEFRPKPEFRERKFDTQRRTGGPSSFEDRLSRFLKADGFKTEYRFQTGRTRCTPCRLRPVECRTTGVFL